MAQSLKRLTDNHGQVSPGITLRATSSVGLRALAILELLLQIVPRGYIFISTQVPHSLTKVCFETAKCQTNREYISLAPRYTQSLHAKHVLVQLRCHLLTVVFDGPYVASCRTTIDGFPGHFLIQRTLLNFDNPGRKPIKRVNPNNKTSVRANALAQMPPKVSKPFLFDFFSSHLPSNFNHGLQIIKRTPTRCTDRFPFFNVLCMVSETANDVVLRSLRLVTFIALFPLIL